MTAPHAEPASPHGPEADLHLSVWPTAQRDARAQRRGRYLPESTAHPAKMLPAIAATAIARYTEPGDLVADPMCGIGTTLVEAVHAGRDGLGIEYEHRWAAVAAANVSHARRNGATGHRRGHPRRRPPAARPPPAGHGRAGRPGRHLTALRPVRPRPGHRRAAARPGGGVRKYDNHYGHDPANLASRGLDELLDGFTEILAGCTGAAAPRRPGRGHRPALARSTASWSTCPPPSWPPAPARA